MHVHRGPDERTDPQRNAADRCLKQETLCYNVDQSFVSQLTCGSWRPHILYQESDLQQILTDLTQEVMRVGMKDICFCLRSSFDTLTLPFSRFFSFYDFKCTQMFEKQDASGRCRWLSAQWESWQKRQRQPLNSVFSASRWIWFMVIPKHQRQGSDPYTGNGGA